MMQASVGMMQPSVGVMQPSVGVMQSSVGMMQPSVAVMQPSIGVMQPSVGLILTTVGGPSMGGTIPAARGLAEIFNGGLYEFFEKAVVWCAEQRVRCIGEVVEAGLTHSFKQAILQGGASTPVQQALFDARMADVAHAVMQEREAKRRCLQHVMLPTHAESSRQQGHPHAQHLQQGSSSNAALHDPNRPALGEWALLPDDIFYRIAAMACEAHPPTAMRMRLTCAEARTRIDTPPAPGARSVRMLAEARRTMWLPTPGVLQHTAYGETISADGFTLSKTAKAIWSAGMPLPTVGVSRWRLALQCESRGQSGAGMCIGVCDSEKRYGYGLRPVDGTLDKQSVQDILSGHCAGGYEFATATPEAQHGFPRVVHGQKVMHRPSSLKGAANGAIVEVIMNHDAGSLAYRINNGPTLPALDGFPKGAALCPWVSMYCHAGDTWKSKISYVSKWI